MPGFHHDILIVIPVRYGSVRFPGKALAAVTGADGIPKPLIQHVWEATICMADIADIIVATDDDRIASVVKAFGGQAMMTSVNARNGTERCAELAHSLSSEHKLIINLQGDSPMVVRSHVDAVISVWRQKKAMVVTPCVTCSAGQQKRLTDDIRQGRPGGTFVVADSDGRALNFSKSPVPAVPGQNALRRLHIGLYAYTPEALEIYRSLPPSPLELAESLEQLRFLENGHPIQVVEVSDAPGGYQDVNYPEDIQILENLLEQKSSGKNRKAATVEKRNSSDRAKA